MVDNIEKSELKISTLCNCSAVSFAFIVPVVIYFFVPEVSHTGLLGINLPQTPCCEALRDLPVGQICCHAWLERLTLNFLVAVVNTLNTKTHSSKQKAEFSFENADVKCICYCKQRMKSKLSYSSECVETNLCKLCASFTSHLHNSCGMVWYRTLGV